LFGSGTEDEHIDRINTFTSREPSLEAPHQAFQDILPTLYHRSLIKPPVNQVEALDLITLEFSGKEVSGHGEKERNPVLSGW